MSKSGLNAQIKKTVVDIVFEAMGNLYEPLEERINDVGSVSFQTSHRLEALIVVMQKKGVFTRQEFADALEEMRALRTEMHRIDELESLIDQVEAIDQWNSSHPDYAHIRGDELNLAEPILKGIMSKDLTYDDALTLAKESNMSERFVAYLQDRKQKNAPVVATDDEEDAQDEVTVASVFDVQEVA